MTNIEEDSLKRVNIIIEKTKAYDNCVFPIGTRGEFGALYISDLKSLLSELEKYKKIAERLAKRIDKLDEENYNYCQSGETHCKETNRCIQCIIDWARKEVENDKQS